MSERKLSAAEQEDAKRLKQIWVNKKDALNLSQVRAAKELGYNSQGAISQYLNGKVGLNFHAAAKFAKLLRVGINEISPRFAPLVTKPLPTELDAYTPPSLGYLNNMPTDAVMDWFAFGESFAEYLEVPCEHIKLVCLDDPTFKEMPPGSVVIVDDSEQSAPTDGVYLLQDGDKIIARRILINGDTVSLSSGQGKKQQFAKDVFGLLKIVGRVRLLVSDVA